MIPKVLGSVEEPSSLLDGRRYPKDQLECSAFTLQPSRSERDTLSALACQCIVSRLTLERSQFDPKVLGRVEEPSSLLDGRRYKDQLECSAFNTSALAEREGHSGSTGLPVHR